MVSSSATYANLPSRIFGLAPAEFRVLKVREILDQHSKSFESQESKALLLRRLSMLEKEIDSTEAKVISEWLKENVGTRSLSDAFVAHRIASYSEVKSEPEVDQQIQQECAIIIKREDDSNLACLGHRKTVLEPVVLVTCLTCVEDLPRTDFPQKAPAWGCKRHEPTVCKSCMTKSINIQIGNELVAWDQIKCPECQALLSFDTIKKYASPAAFEKYDNQAFLSAIKNMPNFTMCLGPSCNSGQIHGGGNDQPIMTCTTCGFKTCFSHQLPWHNNRTCAEYDAWVSGIPDRAERAKQDEESQKLVKQISKVCPNPKCGANVQKISGCDHMTCKLCRSEWCYACGVDYAEIRKKDNRAHTPKCKHHG